MTNLSDLVRPVEAAPKETLEGIEMYRVLDGTGFTDVGCEYVVLQPGQALEEHVHKQARSFILVIDGAGLAIIDGQELPIRKGHTVHVPPGVLHGFRTLDQPLVLYGFQTPPIIRDRADVDIFFQEDGRQGQLYGADV